MKTNTVYFTHDSNARRDPKILALISDYGFEGYGRFWALIELLREQDGKLEITPNNMRAISYELGLNLVDCELFISDLIGYELICKNDEIIFSKRLFESIQHLEQIREKRKIAVEKRWSKSPNNNGLYNCITKVIQNHTKERKGKERKVQEKEKEKEKKKNEKEKIISAKIPVKNPVKKITENSDFFLSLFPENLAALEGFKSAWEIWVNYRKEIKKSIKAHTAKLQLGFLAKQPNPIEVINQSVRNGYTGLFEDKNANTGQHNKTRVGDANGDFKDASNSKFEYL